MSIVYTFLRNLNVFPLYRVPFTLTAMRPGLLLFLTLTLGACASDSDPQRLVDAAIAAHGGPGLDGTVLTFEFRDARFRVTHDGGFFQYERTYSDSTGNVREVLNNDTRYREVNGRRVELTEAQQRSMETAVNSVPYFVLLPWRLNDPAVQKRYLGADTLRGEPYHRVEVTFTPEGGGRDYEDRFVYWFHQHARTMDYLAYLFHTDEGGVRFREAYNPQIVGGLRFQDYRNYEPDSTDSHVPLEDYGRLFEAGRLRLLSDIRTENPTLEQLRAR